jgi:hypothetical protein
MTDAKHIENFKLFCKNNRLRLREAGDFLPIAKAIGKFSDDHFFCNFRQGTIGVYEACYDLEWMNIPPVAKLLKIKKGAAKVKDPTWLK